MKKSSTRLVLLALVAVSCPLLAGCGKGTDSTMSKDEESHFKGGPMPPEARKAIAEQAKQAEAKRAASGAQGGPPPGSTPSNP